MDSTARAPPPVPPKRFSVTPAPALPLPPKPRGLTKTPSTEKHPYANIGDTKKSEGSK
ncbi:hypothetical protein Ocin01_00270 [Orchesella cincta]|uniref:Uncharacterized protein n=1 Tax=Orchesella cincta TaxID=48709 RepID=A0A1D2NM95_ORCCI|nr:hypothetical protein Ocin01_00270 [Orchesella cincta]